MEHLQKVVGSINQFLDVDNCVNFLRNIHTKNACIVMSGLFTEETMSVIHDCRQVNSIYIFCTDKSFYQSWVNKWFKLNGIQIEIESLTKVLKQVRERCDDDAFSMTFNGNDPSFMYSKLLKDALLQIKDVDDKKSIQSFVKYCRRQTDILERSISDFEKNYQPDKSIWYYTKEPFIHGRLNRALQELNVEILHDMGFFIRHLHRQLEEIQKKQHFSTEKSLELYRGQAMSYINFQKLKETANGLVSFNNFLSTTDDKEHALMRATSCAENIPGMDIMGILFVLTIPSSLFSTTVFARITSYSNHRDEEETLFSTHTIFRVNSIEPLNPHQTERLWEVHLDLVDKDSNQLQTLSEQLYSEIEDAAGWNRLGLLLIGMGHARKAEQLYQLLLNTVLSEGETAAYSNQLGIVYNNMDEYSKAKSCFEKTLKIFEKIYATPITLSCCYNNIAFTQQEMGDYPEAIRYLKKAINILEDDPSQHCERRATLYNNIAVLYTNTHQYSDALIFHRKALDIRENNLCENHPDLASSLSNMASFYFGRGEYDNSFSYAQRALDICQTSLHTNDPRLAVSYDKIGLIYNSIGNYQEALNCHKNAFTIYQRANPMDNVNLARVYNNIGLVYNNMNECHKALENLQQAFNICEKVFPRTHPRFIDLLNNIGLVYNNMSKYSEALSHFQEALTICEKSLHKDQSSCARCYRYIGNV